jgi:hypothetical protein
MNFFLRTALAAVFFLAAAELTAEVYLKGPRIERRPKGQGIPDRSFQDLVEQKNLMTEKVICNGVATEVNISLISGNLAELLRELKIRYPDLKMDIRRSGVRFSIPLGKKYQERVLLVGAEGRVTVFTMRLPVPMPSRPEWPSSLPLPPGAEVDEVIRFSRRGSIYAAFNGAEPGALNRVSSTLASYGFMPVTQESATANGTGELFMNAGKKQMLLLSIGEDGTGTMYLAPLSKE